MGTVQSLPLPSFRPPLTPPPLPAYALPASPALQISHRYCVDCRCSKPRTDFQPIFRDDPYGLAETAVRRLLATAKRRPSAKRVCEVRARAILGDPGDKPLRTQPRCRGCNLLRGRRGGSIGHLKKSLASMGYDVTITRSSDHASVVIAGEVPEEALAIGILEDLAIGGVVLLDDDGSPRLPQDPILALRTCYAALLSDRFDGAMGFKRAKLLQRIPELADRKCVEKCALAKRAEDVVDVALVREGGALASVAMERLLSRYWRRYWGKAARAIKSGALSAHEASARLAEGIFDAAISWDPLHTSCAAFATHAWNRVGRALQLRGRKDFAIAVTKGDDGLWTGGAVSFSALSVPGIGGQEAGMLVPNAIDYSAGRPAPRVSAARRDLALRSAVRYDVSSALGTLSATDRQIAEMLWTTPSRISARQVASAVGLTVSDVKARAQQVQSLLTVMLADYVEA